MHIIPSGPCDLQYITLGKANPTYRTLSIPVASGVIDTLPAKYVWTSLKRYLSLSFSPAAAHYFSLIRLKLHA